MDQPRFRLFPGVSISCVLTTPLLAWMDGPEGAPADAEDEVSDAAKEGLRSGAHSAAAPSTTPGRPVRSVVFYARVWITLFANVALWNSMWILIDKNTWDSTTNRNIAFIFVGAWMVYIADGVYGACGVTPARSILTDADVKVCLVSDAFLPHFRFVFPS